MADSDEEYVGDVTEDEDDFPVARNDRTRSGKRKQRGGDDCNGNDKDQQNGEVGGARPPAQVVRRQFRHFAQHQRAVDREGDIRPEGQGEPRAEQAGDNCRHDTAYRGGDELEMAGQKGIFRGRHRVSRPI